jgi:hypothetical protein
MNEKIPKEMTDFQMMVASASAHIYAVNLQILDKHNKEIVCDELISDSVLEAIDLVKAVVECTCEEQR